MGRGDGTKSSRVSLDELLTMRNSPDDLVLEITANDFSDTIKKVWRDTVTGEIGRPGEPAEVFEWRATGIPAREVWMEDGLLHRCGGKPAMTKWAENGALSGEEWHEEGLFVEGPEGFSLINTVGSVDSPARSLVLSRTVIDPETEMLHPLSTDLHPSIIFLDRNGSFQSIEWKNAGGFLSRCKNRPACVTYHPSVKAGETNSPNSVRYSNDGGWFRDDGPCNIYFDSDGSVTSLVYSLGQGAVEISLVDGKWDTRAPETVKITDDKIVLTTRDGAQMSFPFEVPSAEDFAPEKILTPDDLSGAREVFKRYDVGPVKTSGSSGTLYSDAQQS